MQKLETSVKLKQLLLDIELDYINRALHTTSGMVQNAANLLGVKRTALSMRLAFFGDKIIMPKKIKTITKKEIIAQERKKRMQERRIAKEAKILENEKMRIEREEKRILKDQLKKESLELLSSKKTKKELEQYIPLPFNPVDKIRYNDWTNKDTYLCACAIENMTEHFIRKVILIARSDQGINTKKRILNVLAESGSTDKFKVVNVNFNEIANEYKNVKIKLRIR